MSGNNKGKRFATKTKHRCWATVCETGGGYVGLAASAYGLAASTLPRASEDGARQALFVCLGGAALRGWFDEPEWLTPAEGLPPHLAAAREAFAASGGELVRCLGRLQIDLRPHPPFTARVLEAVRGLAPGETSTYGDVAQKVGVAGGARAVGQVMSHNPLAPVVPCHRVLSAGDRIGGFGGGPDMKARMLRGEGLQVDGDRVRRTPV
ncbi:MAG: MGMT family protein [Bacillota bacterium]|nr:MGMT family protein [Bacillota bacterium]